MKTIRLLFYSALAGISLIMAGYVALLIIEATHCHGVKEAAVPLVSTTPFLIGLSLVWSSIKGHKWARYSLGIYSVVAFLLSLFMPLAQHSIDRTLLFYGLWTVVLLLFGSVAYLLLWNNEIIDHLDSKRRQVSPR